MAEIKELQTQFVYPAFNFEHTEHHEPGKYKFSKPKKITINLEVTTYIRKKYRNVWYLIPLIMKTEHPVYEIKKKHEIEQKVIAEFIKQFYLTAYKNIILFILNAQMINPYLRDERIAIYKDIDQRDESERLGIKKNKDHE